MPNLRPALKLKIIIILIAPCIHCPNAYSQQNDTQAAIFNISAGALVSGIGAMINKKPIEKIPRLLVRGMMQGAVGGYLVYQSKQLIYNFAQTDNYALVWSSKLLNAAGTSIIENASSNRKFLSTWHLTIGFNRIELDTENGMNVHYKIMPLALYSFIYSSTQATFNFSQTISTGQPIFTTNKINTSYPSTSVADSWTITNSIILLNTLPDNRALAREMIRAYQYEGIGVINTFFDKPRANWVNNDVKFVRNYKKWVYTDVNYILFEELYRLEGRNNPCHFTNIFEQEANFYSYKRICN
jgi:hypothetical protein